MSDKIAPRTLIYRFLEAPYPERMNLASRLGLIDKADGGAADSELALRFVQRAVSRGLLKKFRDEILLLRETTG